MKLNSPLSIQRNKCNNDGNSITVFQSVVSLYHLMSQFSFQQMSNPEINY